MYWILAQRLKIVKRLGAPLFTLLNTNTLMNSRVFLKNNFCQSAELFLDKHKAMPDRLYLLLESLQYARDGGGFKWIFFLELVTDRTARIFFKLQENELYLINCAI